MDLEVGIRMLFNRKQGTVGSYRTVQDRIASYMWLYNQSTIIAYNRVGTPGVRFTTKQSREIMLELGYHIVGATLLLNDFKNKNLTWT